MIRSLTGSVLLTASFAAAASPDPLTQLNHPVIGLGETAALEVQIPAYRGGGSSFLAYSINLKDADNARLMGYAALAVECPVGFLTNLYDGAAGGVCYRMDTAPHAAAVMRVEILNQDAADGLTHWPEALRVTDLSVPGGVTGPLQLYGVRP